MRALAAAKVGRFTVCAKSCVALQGLDRSAQRICVVPSVMYYITLHYITLHYITLHYITLHYITLHYITLRYIIM
jgi:hypothetical protein